MGPALAARLQELSATFWPGSSPSIGTASAQLIACADLSDELRARDEVNKQLGSMPCRLVIDPRLKVRRALAVQAFEHELHGSELLALPGEPLYGIEGGQRPADPARSSSAYVGLLQLSGAPLEFRPLAALLRSPYVGCGTLAQRAALELTLRERNVAEADLGRLSRRQHVRSAAPTALPWRTLQAFGRATDAQATSRDPQPDEHHADSPYGLRGQPWPNPESLGSEEQQQCERMRELLGELSTLGGSGALLDFTQALDLLRELAASASFEAATLDAPVTLTESIDDPLVEYDGIWVRLQGAENWPPISCRPTFLLPVAAQLPRARFRQRPWTTRRGAPGAGGVAALYTSPDLELAGGRRRGHAAAEPSAGRAGTRTADAEAARAGGRAWIAHDGLLHATRAADRGLWT